MEKPKYDEDEEEIIEQKNILVVNHNKDALNSLKSLLERMGLNVFEAYDGEEAKAKIEDYDYNLVCAEIQIPLLNGIELLHWCNKEKIVPFILLHSSKHIIDKEEAKELKADGTLKYPFDKAEVLKLLSEVFGETIEELPEDKLPEINLDDQFSKFSIEQLLFGKEIKFQIFARLSQSKYVKVAHKGEDITKERLLTYKNKGVKFLYMKKNDFCDQVDFSFREIKGLSKKPKVPGKKKRDLLRHSEEILIEGIFMDGVKESDLKMAQELMSIHMDILSDHGEAFDLLEHFSQYSDYLYGHSLAVGSFGVLMAKNLGWNSFTTNFKISTAGLFHDIGMVHVERRIFETPEEHLKPKELRIYHSHPQKSIELLRQVGGFPSDVLQMIAQHHENIMGSGFPHQLGKGKIMPLALLLGTANMFCKLSMKNSKNEGGMGAKDAVSYMESQHGRELDKKMLEAIKGVLS